jgi:hypothetical protein
VIESFPEHLPVHSIHDEVRTKTPEVEASGSSLGLLEVSGVDAAEHSRLGQTQIELPALVAQDATHAFEEGAIKGVGV